MFGVEIYSTCLLHIGVLFCIEGVAPIRGAYCGAYKDLIEKSGA